MGLALEVGILADLKQEDEEGFQYHAQALERLNGYLASKGLPRHVEPTECDLWSAEMISYSGLHDVRRLAAYIDGGRPLPPPSFTGSDSSKDPCLEGYFALVEGTKVKTGLLGRVFGSAPRYRREFDHLIVHGDAEGYYLPIDFAEVLITPEKLEIPGCMVGSVPRLARELERLAEVLKIPPSLAAGSEELWEASDTPRPDGEMWERYGRESFGIVTLRDGCKAAMTNGAALVFC